MLLEPLMVAVNCCVPLVSMEAEAGDIVTETTGAAVTLTIADACWVGSATLVANTRNAPVVFGGGL